MYRATKGTRAVSLTSLLVLLGFVGACAVPSRSDEESSAPSSYGGARASVVNPDVVQSITFEKPSGPVVLPVLGQLQLEVHVSPASNQTVAFAIVGTGMDATLETALVASDALGNAANILTASSSPTTFSIRASLDKTTTTEIPISVVGAMTGSLDVSVRYSGTRQVRLFYVTVYPGRDCTSPNLGEAGQSRIDAPPTTSLPTRVEAVPLDRSLAVVVSGDGAVRGCATAHNVPGADSLAVEVTVDDLPLNLHNSALELGMSIGTGQDALSGELSDYIPNFANALVQQDHDLLDLLASMQSSAIGSLKDEFSSLRAASDWDDLVVNEYASVGGNSLLRRHLSDWANRAMSLLSKQPVFRVRLELGPNDYSPPYLSLLDFAGIDVTTSKLMGSSALALDTKANDQLSWSSTLTWSNSRLLDLLAFAAASVDHPGLDGIAALLAQALDCDQFGTLLDSHAIWTSASLRGCTAECLAGLCRSAIGDMYARTQRPTINGSGYQEQARLSFSASGPVVVDADAIPRSMSGSWTGILSSESGAWDLAGEYQSQ